MRADSAEQPIGGNAKGKLSNDPNFPCEGEFGVFVFVFLWINFTRKTVLGPTMTTAVPPRRRSQTIKHKYPTTYRRDIAFAPTLSLQ